MNNITTVGLDLAKNVSHIVCCNRAGKVIKKRMLRRNEILNYFSKLPRCVVGIEACASAHFWARKIVAIGHEVKQIAPQHVKAYVRGNKTDYNDALAIAEAVVRPEMRFVATKTVEQQDIQALHKLRKLCERDRTANCNAIRGLLYEYGIVMKQGIKTVYTQLPELFDEANTNGLSVLFKSLLKQHYQKLLELDEHLEEYTRQIKQLSTCEDCQRLQQIPGYGPIISSAFYQHVGNGSAFNNGRAVSASVGVIPRQHSSGGKHNLLGISKRGDVYLRTLLIHGARAVIRTHGNKDTPLARWIQRIVQTRGKNKAAVALANKLARIGWAMLRYKTNYRAELVCA